MFGVNCVGDRGLGFELGLGVGLGLLGFGFSEKGEATII